MNRTAIRIAIALATFLIGVSVVYLVWFTSGRSTPASTVVSSRTPEPEKGPIATSDAKVEEKSVEVEWAELIQAGGCLFGSEYYTEEPAPIEEPGAFYDPRWQAFFRRTKQETVPFLVNQIPYKSKTHLHVDPYQPPTKGELAVYALQHVLKVNWYELKEDYKSRFEKAGYPFTYQDLLQQIIKTKGGAKEMQDLWMEYYKNHSS